MAHKVSWQTDPLPESSGDSYQLIWLAGIECAGFSAEKESHPFNLLIDGQLWFTFKNAKDATAKAWHVAGRDGAELSFVATTTDHVGDLFGYMTLKLPASDFPSGKPLTLEVQGDNSGSADWYMTFQHRFNFVPQVRSEPALVKEGAHTLQQLRLSLDNLVLGRTVEVHVPDHEPIRADLNIGANVLRLSIPAVASATTIPVVFNLNGNVVEIITVPIAPVHKRISIFSPTLTTTLDTPTCSVTSNANSGTTWSRPCASSATPGTILPMPATNGIWKPSGPCRAI